MKGVGFMGQVSALKHIFSGGLRWSQDHFYEHSTQHLWHIITTGSPHTLRQAF